MVNVPLFHLFLHRYVGYFSGLVTGALILQDRLVYLHAVVYRNPSQSRLLSTTATVGASLEPIAEANSSENNNNHEDQNHVAMDTSIYARPEDIQPPPRDITTSAVLRPSEWSPTEPRPMGSMWDWGRLASVDYETHGISEHPERSGSANRVNGIFPTEQERLYDVTSTIEREMLPSRTARNNDDDDGVNSMRVTDWSRGLQSLRSFVERDGGILLKIYQNLKLMHTTRLLWVLPFWNV